MKKERSLSVSSYMASPKVLSPPVTPLNTKTTSSATPSPRNLSLPANKLFFFPPTFNPSDIASTVRKLSSTDLGSAPVSRKTSGGDYETIFYKCAKYSI